MSRKRQTMVLYGALGGAECCWLYALLFLVNHRLVSASVSDYGILLFYPVSVGFHFWAGRLPWRAFIRYGLSIIVWAALAVLAVKVYLSCGETWMDFALCLGLSDAPQIAVSAFRPALFVLCASAVTWWLGRRLALLQMNFRLIVTEFQFGLIILFLSFWFSWRLGGEMAGALPVLFLFFFFALVGVVGTIERENADGSDGLAGGQRAVLLIVSMVLITAAGLLVSFIMTPGLLEAIVSVIRRAGEWIMELLSVLTGFLPGESPPIDTTLNVVAPQAQPGEPQLAIPERMLKVSRLVWTLVFLLLAALALWRISADVSRWLAGRIPVVTDGETSRAAGSPLGRLYAYIRQVLAQRVKQIKRLLFQKTAAVPPEIKSMRHIYRQMLRWAAALGWPRPASVTPDEYLIRLNELMPRQRDALALITASYVACRYGRAAPTKNELERIRKVWHTIRREDAGKIKLRLTTATEGNHEKG